MSQKNVKQIAGEIIGDHASDIEYLSIYEWFEGRDGYENLSDDELDKLVDMVDDMIRRAVITISWRQND